MTDHSYWFFAVVDRSPRWILAHFLLVFIVERSVSRSLELRVEILSRRQARKS